jgi:hypothetical protein
MTALTKGGFYERNQALSLVAKMGLIIASLTILAWFLVRLPRTTPRSERQLAFGATWKSALILWAYVFVVLLRRELWTPAQGIDDNAMFLPLVGHVNSQFLGEFRCFPFLFVVVPIMAVVSGMFFYLTNRITGGSFHPST